MNTADSLDISKIYIGRLFCFYVQRYRIMLVMFALSLPGPGIEAPKDLQRAQQPKRCDYNKDVIKIQM